MKEETQAAGVRRRRSRMEVDELVAEFEASGLNRTEFCRTHGLSLSTLNRYRNRRPQRGETVSGARWLAVEMSGPGQVGGSGLAVVSASGWRLEVGRGFDADTLAQVLRVLERG